MRRGQANRERAGAARDAAVSWRVRLHLPLALILAIPAAGAAQSPVRVTGVAWDSLSGRGLGSAFVALGTRGAFADSLGRFSFDSVMPGTWRVTVQHDVIDSLGLPGISASIVVGRGRNDFRIATPSSRTMWRRVCPGEQPRDSGFVFGVVRNAKRQPAGGAALVASWIELVNVGREIMPKGWRLDTRTPDDGSYVICGVPVGSVTRLEAALDSTAWAGIDVLLSDKSSVRRQDLTLTDVADSTARGTIRGFVTSEAAPVPNARVETDGMPEIRTGSDGGFILRDVRAGTRQVYVQGIGFAPESRIIEVAAGDTTTLTITVGKATQLDSIVATAPTARTRIANQFADRRRQGLGYFRDSTQLGKYLSLEGAFATMPSVTTERGYGAPLSIRIGGIRMRGTRISGGCQAWIFVDGVRSDAERLDALRPSDLAAMEVYRTGEMPSELAVQFGLNPFSKPCAVVAWTKNGWS
jgi:hypothetical protein